MANHAIVLGGMRSCMHAEPAAGRPIALAHKSLSPGKCILMQNIVKHYHAGLNFTLLGAAQQCNPAASAWAAPHAVLLTGSRLRAADTEGSFMVERVAEMADAVVRHLKRLASRRDPSERPLVVRHPHSSMFKFQASDEC